MALIQDEYSSAALSVHSIIYKDAEIIVTVSDTDTEGFPAVHVFKSYGEFRKWWNDAFLPSLKLV